MMSFNQVEVEIVRWAEDRKIIPNSTPSAQLLKMVSEVGELADAEGKKDIFEIEDAVGDIVVCLINYCTLRDISLLKCLNSAYETIKDRKGTLMPDGTFMKSSS